MAQACRRSTTMQRQGTSLAVVQLVGHLKVQPGGEADIRVG